jgi:hypothetical protein
LRRSASTAVGVVINISGALDPESVARHIASVENADGQRLGFLVTYAERIGGTCGVPGLQPELARPTVSEGGSCRMTVPPMVWDPWRVPIWSITAEAAGARHHSLEAPTGGCAHRTVAYCRPAAEEMPGNW